MPVKAKIEWHFLRQIEREACQDFVAEIEKQEYWQAMEIAEELKTLRMELEFRNDD